MSTTKVMVNPYPLFCIIYTIMMNRNQLCRKVVNLSGMILVSYFYRW